MPSPASSTIEGLVPTAPTTVSKVDSLQSSVVQVANRNELSDASAQATRGMPSLPIAIDVLVCRSSLAFSSSRTSVAACSGMKTSASRDA